MSNLLPGAEKYLNMSSKDYWKERLANARALLDNIEAAIVFLQSSDGANGTVEYTIDTGQDRQSVKRSDLPNLISARTRLLNEIAQLERTLGLNGSAARRIVPGF